MIAINIDGKIKTYSTPPEKWKYSDGTEVSPYKYDEETQYEDGFREVVIPQVTEGKKLGAIQYDAVNDVFTYPLIDKSAEELAAEAESKKQMEAEKIKQKYIDRIVLDAVSPTDALQLFKEWEPRAYALKEGAIFKGKPFRNTIEGNTNAPDKGGWIEIK